MTTRAAFDARAGHAPRARSRPARVRALAWAVLGYTLLVILFGAVVRVTGSGAGCGQHWPTCHGEITHLPRQLETAIELTHRVTSGLSLLLSIGLVVAVRKLHSGGHLARRAAWASLVFLVIEALIGAGLVLFALVADDASAARAIVMPAHLVNTSLLMGCLTLTAWAVGQDRPGLRLHSKVGWLLVSGLLLLLVVSGTGAVTALGDTLYPVSGSAPLGERVVEAHAAGTLVERMRSWHPLLAVLTALYLCALASRLDKPSGLGARLAFLVIASVLGQLLVGLVNVWLSAPGWMQVLHLAVANGVWVLWVLFTLELTKRAAR